MCYNEGMTTLTDLLAFASSRRAGQQRLQASLADGPAYLIEFRHDAWVAETVVDGEAFPIGSEDTLAGATNLAQNHARWFTARQGRRVARGRA